jgi:hypothetical protein
MSGIDAHIHPEPAPLHNNETCLESAKSPPMKRLVGVNAVLLFKCVSFPVVTFRLADRCLPFLIPRFTFLIEPWIGANWVIQNEKKEVGQEGQGFRNLNP